MLASRLSFGRPLLFSTVLASSLALVSPSMLEAQPFGQTLNLQGNSEEGGPGHGYVEIPHHPDLNPVDAFTLEAWVQIFGPGCRSVAGKRWVEAWWVGFCGNTLRSYLAGSPSLEVGGVVTRGEWTHIAVTFDGTRRRHYVNAEVALDVPQTGALPATTDPLRIGSDVALEWSIWGQIDEVRLWNVSRSQAQIQESMVQPITAPQPGLVAVWALDGDGQDRLGIHHGSVMGDATFSGAEPPEDGWITSSEFPDFRFRVQIQAGGTDILGTKEPLCLPETVCVSGALPGRSEVFLRVIGPRPNGFLWPVLVKFTPSEVEVWIEQLSTGEIQQYELPTRGDELPGLFDRLGFLP